MVNDYIEKTMVYCVQQQNIIIQSLFLSKHFPTDRSSRLSRHNHESAKAFSRSPVNFRGHGFVVSNVMTYLLQLTIFARKEAQLWTASAEYRLLIFRQYSSLFTLLSDFEQKFYIKYSNAVKFIYSEKATKFCKISVLLLSVWTCRQK